MNPDYISVLRDLGFTESSITGKGDDQVAIERGLRLLGDSVYKTLLSHLSALYRLPEKEFLTRYDLLEKALHVIFKDGASIILDKINEEMLELKSVKPKQDLIRDHERSVIEFVRTVPEHEHIVILYKDEGFKEKVISAYLGSDSIDHTAKGLIAANSKGVSDLSHLAYSELVQLKSNINEKVSTWIYGLLGSNQSHYSTIRVALEDGSLFFENGFGSQIFTIEETMNKHSKFSLSFLCAYDASKIPKDLLKDVITSHHYVVLEEPHSVYLRTRGPRSEYLKILIAEDEVNVAKQYKIMLEKMGHQVVVTQNGEDCIMEYINAMEMAENKTGDNFLPFDAVVLDHRMPKKNGMEVAKEILKVKPQQRIIFASAYVRDTLVESVKELNQVVELLQKPFELDLLVDTIEDKQIYSKLEDLNVKVKLIKDFNPSHREVDDLLNGLRILMKGRTF